MKKKIIFRFMGLKAVDFNGYDFHITPVLSYSKTVHANGDNAKGIAIEWGHWAVYIALLTIITSNK